MRAENIGKMYLIGANEGYQTFRETISRSFTAPFRWVKGERKKVTKEPFWALRDVSLQVKQGDVVGILGRNGAGKSTLLKVFSRITSPTTGRAVLRGRLDLRTVPRSRFTEMAAAILTRRYTSP